MGNDQTQEEEETMPPQENKTQQRFIMEIRDRDIVLSWKEGIKLKIGDLKIFPSGYERLRLWDSHIVLSRYVLKNVDMFKGKEVIELMAGTGITSITLKKYSQLAKLAATDRNPQITENIRKNCLKNGITKNMIIATISWAQYEKFTTTYDIVLGADLIQENCPVEIFVNVLRKLVKQGGKALILVTKKYRTFDEFVEAIGDQWKFHQQKIIGEEYYESPLMNKVLGYQEFQNLLDHSFTILHLKRVGQKRKGSSHSYQKNYEIEKQIQQMKNVKEQEAEVVQNRSRKKGGSEDIQKTLTKENKQQIIQNDEQKKEVEEKQQKKKQISENNDEKKSLENENENQKSKVIQEKEKNLEEQHIKTQTQKDKQVQSQEEKSSQT